jgi:hypothetical protein
MSRRADLCAKGISEVILCLRPRLRVCQDDVAQRHPTVERSALYIHPDTHVKRLREREIKFHFDKPLLTRLDSRVCEPSIGVNVDNVAYLRGLL